VPLTVALEMVRLAAPELDSVSVCVCVLPIVALPKLMDPGVTASVPLKLVPLPARATDTDGSEAFEVSESVALFVPAVVGEKVTARLALVPAARV
jgi:hypothetical protein